jgi:anthranilate synthase/aminodeoxychorismate synthase-like glutamine amidotransferase
MKYLVFMPKRAFMGKIPILGVCLGHEVMVEVFGAKIVHCGEVKHGKVSLLSHDHKVKTNSLNITNTKQGVYEGIPENIPVTRYHSLAADEKTLEGTELTVTSRSESGIIMGLRHNKYTIEGVQYHPESIKTEFGMKMLENFLKFEGGFWKL